jgi:hypothetical protein
VWNYNLDQDIILDVLGVFNSLEDAVNFSKLYKDIQKSDIWIDILKFENNQKKNVGLVDKTGFTPNIINT